MNTYIGNFSNEERASFDSVVSGWTFWNQGTFYAKNPNTPDKRYTGVSAHDLYMQITISAGAGRIGW